MATQTLPWSYTQKTLSNNFAGSTTSGTVTETRSDTRSPLVKTPSGRWRPPTDYSRSIRDGETSCFNLVLHDEWQQSGANQRSSLIGGGYVNSSGFYYRSNPAFPSNLESQAIIKARLKLKDMNVNLAQAFAERGQTVRLVGNTLGELTDMVRMIKRRRMPNRLFNKFDKQGWFFDRWLELQYGWKPLLSDVYGSVSALHEKEKLGERGLVCVKASVQARDVNVTRLNSALGSTNFSYDRVCDTRHKGFIRLDFMQSNSPPVGTLSALGIMNPIELAWELLPWSFVADWFIPIGDYLSSLDATLGWDFKGGSFSSKTTTKNKANNFLMTPKFDGTRNSRSGYIYAINSSGRQMKFDRKTYSSAPLPSLPSLAKWNKAGHEHVANGIALFMGAILGSSSKVR